MKFFGSKPTDKFNTLDKDLNVLIKKHKIKRGILLIAMQRGDKIVQKDVVFGNIHDEFSLCTYADLFLDLMKASPVFESIINHATEHVLRDGSHDAVSSKLREKKGKKTIIN